MPFIKQWRRSIIELKGLEALELTDAIEPGDRCYVYYSQMVGAWRANPRWTTAHNIMKSFGLTEPIASDDDFIAAHLAWQVFFQLYVMPYELKKRKENGDI